MMESPSRSRWIGVSLLAALIFLLLLVRFYNENHLSLRASALPVIVGVRGDVEHPGIYLLKDPRATALDAVEAAGGCGSYFPDKSSQTSLMQEIHSGELLHISCRQPGEIKIRKELMEASARLTLGEKLDVNEATEMELLLVPRMKHEFAQAIVRGRRENPWQNLEELEKIPGVGPKTVEKWERYLEVGDGKDSHE